MKNKIISYLITLTATLFWETSHAGVIFQDNFDEQPNWEPTSSVECNQGDCSSQVPSGWAYYRSMGHFNTDTSPSGHNTINISNEHFRGSSGKGFTVWTESYTPWSADGLMTVSLGQDYDEIFMASWIQMQPGWQWDSKDNAALKIFRAMHYDGAGNSFVFFGDGTSGPIYVFDLKNTINYGWRHNHAIRCDPQESVYYCGDQEPSWNNLWPGNPTFAEHIGDGQWHHIEVQLKMNTGAPGNWNRDGILRVWFDGELVEEVTSFAFLMNDSPGVGWNSVGIGGNQMNVFTDTTSGDEQWYAFDDFVVSTTRIGVGPAPRTIIINSVEKLNN